MKLCKRRAKRERESIKIILSSGYLDEQDLNLKDHDLKFCSVYIDLTQGERGREQRRSMSHQANKNSYLIICIQAAISPFFYIIHDRRIAKVLKALSLSFYFVYTRRLDYTSIDRERHYKLCIY